MNVAVEQAGQQGFAFDVYALIAIQAGADVNDSTLLDGNIGRCRIGATTIEDKAPAQNNARSCFITHAPNVRRRVGSAASAGQRMPVS